MFEAFLWLEQRAANRKSKDRNICLWHFPLDASESLDEYKDLHNFCFPDLELQSLHSPVMLQNDLHIFPLTDSRGSKRYGVCLKCFCNGEGKRYDVKRRRKCCLCLVTEYPYFTLLYRLLLQVHSMCLLDNDMVSAKNFLELLHTRGLVHKYGIKLNRFQATYAMRFVLPEGGRKWCPDVPILPLLEALGAYRFLLLLSSILCERRILFIAENASMLSAKVLASVTMLHPFQWQVLSRAPQFYQLVISCSQCIVLVLYIFLFI